MAIWGDEVISSKQSTAKKSHDDSMKMAAEKTHEDLIEEESWGEDLILDDEKGAPKCNDDLTIYDDGIISSKQNAGKKAMMIQ